MKILVIGGSGVIGSKITEYFKQKNYDVNFTYMKHKSNLDNGQHLNITQKHDTVKLIKKNNPDVIIHCVALTNMDECETDKEKANQINVQGIDNVVFAAKIINNKIIFISTSAVFNGEKLEYVESDKICPISHYGKTKAIGEEIVESSGLPYLILRTDQPYCQIKKWQHTNSVLRTIETLKEKKILKEIRDWKNRPTYVPNFVQSLEILLESNVKGIFHVVGNEYISRYEMALKTAEVFNLNKELVIPINSDELQLSAKRVNVNLGNKKLLRTTRFKMYNFEQGLRDMLIHSNH